MELTGGTEAMGGPGATGVIKLEGGFMDGRIRGWLKPWPPPEHLIAARGRESDLDALAADDDDFRALLPELREIDAEIIRYVRISYSKLPDDSLDHPHIARVALYGYDGRM